jgi:hypothetical protein
VIEMNCYPLIFIFLIILLNLRSPVSTTITPKIEVYFLLITGERSKIIDMKTHISLIHHKLENPFRDLQRSDINRSTTNGCFQKKSNRMLRKPELASTKRRQKDEIMAAWEELETDSPKRVLIVGWTPTPGEKLRP